MVSVDINSNILERERERDREEKKVEFTFIYAVFQKFWMLMFIVLFVCSGITVATFKPPQADDERPEWC